MARRRLPLGAAMYIQELRQEEQEEADVVVLDSLGDVLSGGHGNLLHDIGRHLLHRRVSTAQALC